MENEVQNHSASWFDWLLEAEGKTKNSYLAKPQSLIAGFLNEAAVAEDYSGRELLELLQNAADEAGSKGIPGRVELRLRRDGLLVANTGATFSKDGVSSLEQAYLSPKRQNKKQYIGNKGLGFRSILNWTKSPIILSGELAIAYSDKWLRKKLKELTDASAELEALVDKEESEADSIVCPRLSFPAYSPDGDILSLLESDAQRALYQESLELLNDGYDTVIALPFISVDLQETVKDQLESLRPEILLFVDNLHEVNFRVLDLEVRQWTVEGDNNAKMVLENSDPIGIWQVFQTEGVIPDEFNSDASSSQAYEIKVAVPENEDADEIEASPLFSYFPTNIELPLPSVCHATLDLDQSRNHIRNSKSNQFVLLELARFIAAIAAIRASRHPVGVNAGFRHVLSLGTYPPELQRVGFQTELLSSAREKALVPVLAGGVVEPSSALLLDFASSEWLPDNYFEDVVPFQGWDATSLFNKLGVEGISVDAFRKRLLNCGEFSLQKKLLLIENLAKSPGLQSASSSSLLISSSGESIPDGADVFILPDKLDIPDLPDWVDLYFLDKEFQKLLQESLDCEDVRSLQKKLSSFGLVEYSLGTLIQRVVSSANRAKKQSEIKSPLIAEQLVLFVYELYTNEDSSRRPSFPSQLSVPLISQSGEYIAATELYFGEGFGIEGAVVQSLYETFAKDVLVSKKDLPIDATTEEIELFLTWLGVEKWPRKVATDDFEWSYRQHVVDSFLFPVRFDEYEFRSAEEFGYLDIKKVSTLDRLESILEGSDPVAISAWLAIDARMLTLFQPSFSNARIGTVRDYDRNLRYFHGSVPSYIEYKITRSPWLTSEGGESVPPVSTVYGLRRVLGQCYPSPLVPDNEKLAKFGLARSVIREGWRRAGVITSLEDLSVNQVYQILSDLHELDPEGSYAKSFYQWFLNDFDEGVLVSSIESDEFVENGKLLGKCEGQIDYYPVSDLYHVDREGLPSIFLDRLRIASLPYRIGAKKVKRMLGIRAIERSQLEKNIESYEEIKNDASLEFEKTKPYFYLYRSSSTKQRMNLAALKNIKLKLCRNLKAAMKYENHNVEVNLEQWEWVIDDDTVYMCCGDSDYIDHSHPDLSSVVGDAVADLFQVTNGGEYARLFAQQRNYRNSLIKRLCPDLDDKSISDTIQVFKDEKRFTELLSAHGEIQDPEENDIVRKHEEFDDVSKNQGDKKAPNQSGSVGKEAEVDAPEDDRQEHSSTSGQGISPVITPVEHNVRDYVKKPMVVRSVENTDAEEVARPTVQISGDYAERKVEEFEESEAEGKPKRYALRVGQFMGFEAPGCDILSFSKIEDRDAFRSGECRNLDKVERFIEVKKRKNMSEIELRGNEKSAALNYEDKYFIYRLVFEDENNYKISILSDPLSHSKAIEESVYVHLDRIEEVDAFDVSECTSPQ